MAITEAPDGIRIGTTDNERLPIYDFDEYVFEHELGEMTAGEVRVLDFGECTTFRGGQTLVACLINPQANNAQHLLIQHVWYDLTGLTPAVKVRVRNLSSSTVDFSTDQIVVGGWNTTAPA